MNRRVPVLGTALVAVAVAASPAVAQSPSAAPTGGSGQPISIPAQYVSPEAQTADTVVDTSAFAKDGPWKLCVSAGYMTNSWVVFALQHIKYQASLEPRYEPDIVAGTSIGAVVGGLYLAGRLDELETWARSLDKRSVRALMDISLGSGGLVAGKRLKALLDQYIDGILIENLNRNFAAVATELKTVKDHNRCADENRFQRLKAAGLVVGETRADVRMRCRLYELYFKDHL